MKNYGIGNCAYCGKEFRKAVWNQEFCKETHSQRCSDCGEIFFWVGRPFYTKFHSKDSPACSVCKNKRVSSNSSKSQREWTPEQRKTVVEKRKATMVLRHGAETTLQSPKLRARRDATMESLYGAASVKNSSQSLLNAASKRSKAKGIPLEKSLEISNLLNDEELLEDYLEKVFLKFSGKFSYYDLACELDSRLDAAELSHKLSKLPRLKNQFINVKDSWLEILVLRELNKLGFQEGLDFRRHHKLKNRKEIDILFFCGVGFEINGH